MDASASLNLWTQIAEESAAAKFIMEVLVWSPAQQEFGWSGTYNINAPNGYDTEYARTYTAQFAEAVAEDLKNAGLLP